MRRGIQSRANLDDGTNVVELFSVLKGGNTVTADNSIELFVCFGLNFGVSRDESAEPLDEGGGL